MNTISQLQSLINQAVADTKYPESPAELYQPISYLMELGGKRLRPVSVLMACNLFTNDVDKALKAALGIEVFHNFTLMHDDIMDQAPLRRGQPTVHEKWNQNVAILSGDVMLVEAYKLMMQVEPAILPAVLTIFNDTAVGVCEGQQRDMNFEKRDEVSIEEYLQMICQKTAVLLGGALKIGALIGGSSETDADLLYQFGVNLGIAFQLHDDILDVYGDPEKFGKQVGGDILANKKTFMLISAKALANGPLAQELNNWLSHQNNPANSKVQAVTAIYNQLGVRQLAEIEMRRYADKALQALQQVSVLESQKETLKNFALDLLNRES
ncbi:MAG TPA: polyprenyl synthetase family protein [Daejeonella sp.]|nr:polyprenyl synthetase family protein [Daejeonella sp.]